MTQLRSLLERIEAGSGPSLGFGSTQSGRLPGMALIARCSGDIEAALAAAGEAADALVIAAPGLSPDGIPEVGDRIWGAGGAPLTPESAAQWQEAGADFMVSPPPGAHGMRIPDETNDTIWRMLAAAPVDFLVLDKSAMTAPWTFADLGQVAEAVSRTDKFQFVRIGPRPSANELLALRQAGAVAIVAEANDHGAAGLAAIKADLMAMPRAQPASRRGGRTGLESAAT